MSGADKYQKYITKNYKLNLRYRRDETGDINFATVKHLPEAKEFCVSRIFHLLSFVWLH